jgi:alpha-N-arabinofuranosidase
MRWCRKVDVEPMMAVNLGTRGIEDATRLLEYCNLPGGTELSELRRAHGVAEPYDVKLWCLGNEMDGPWQIGRKTAEEYGRLAAETANAMRMVDPSLQLVACGSSYRAIETFGEWERTVLEQCYGRVDYLSLHTYYGNAANNGGEFLARSDEMDVFIKEVLAICDSVKARKRSNKTVNLSFDEWNVWFHTLEDDKKVTPWTRAPRLLEDVYTAEDATLVGGMLITLLNNADRVKIACLAQLVNVIAPIMTETGGRAWRQTIFHPFALTAAAAKGGTTLRQYVESDRYDAGTAVDAPFLASSCVRTRDGGLAVFAVNRSYDKELELSIEFPGLDSLPTRRWTTLSHDDPKATNTADRPNEVAPVDAGRVSVTGNVAKLALPPHSWNLIQFAPSP